MPQNYVLLETIELTQTTASVTFDNLPTSGYSDLKIVVCARSNRSTEIRDELFVRFNGDSGANYTYKTLRGISTTADALSGSGVSAIFRNDMTASGATANTFSNQEIYIPSYRSSSAKTVSIDSVMENNGANSTVHLSAGYWSGTSAITSITLLPEVSTFTANSTFSLYAISDVNTTPITSPLATGGNVVANDGTYWYHAFLSSGTFTTQKALTCDILQVAGGGGGGANNGGGGGAGGLNAITGTSLGIGSNLVTVGSGGAGSPGNSPRGSNGSNSQFASLTAAVGGGGGGSYFDLTPGNGGSGGGGGGNAEGGSASGGTATAGQGFAGGNGNAAGNPNHSGGGGGGAGAAGANGNSTSNGGVGVSTYSSWGLATTTGHNSSGTVYYAGGGGGAKSNTSGGSGGLGGGGNGGGATTQSPGQRGTGGGGGAQPNQGTGSSTIGQNGGSGIVIIRYPMAS